MNHSAEERIERGRRERKKLSRASLGELPAATDPKKQAARGFDPLEVLRTHTDGRLKHLLPLKYERMAADPFAFFRGAAAIMAADLGRLPHTSIEVQLCGDAHVQNIGSFAAPDGKLVFDFNDFDETIRGPFEWDLKRMAASIVLAGRAVNHKRAACCSAVEIFVERYCFFMEQFSREPILNGARHQIHRGERVSAIHAALQQSQRATPAELVKKYTDHGREFRTQRPQMWRVRGAEAKTVLASLAPYRESLRPESRHVFDLFRPVDVGFKVVGTGSVGLRDYIVLLEGNGSKDALFLQIKQEMPSAYAPFLPHVSYQHEGRRAAEGQRAIQPLSDMLLGWTSLGGYEFLVRQMNDHKGSVDLKLLRGAGLNELASVVGELMARGHARSGDACVIYGYCGSGSKMVAAIRDFAAAYGDLTESDYEKFCSSRALVKPK